MVVGRTSGVTPEKPTGGIDDPLEECHPGEHWVAGDDVGRLLMTRLDGDVPKAATTDTAEPYRWIINSSVLNGDLQAPVSVAFKAAAVGQDNSSEKSSQFLHRHPTESEFRRALPFVFLCRTADGEDPWS